MSKTKRVKVIEKEGPRLFSGCFPCGIGYADRYREVGGDYMKLGFLSYSTLILDVEKDCPPELAEQIKRDASRLQALCGKPYPIAGNATALLGEKMKTPCGHNSMTNDHPKAPGVFRCNRPSCDYVYSKVDQPTLG